MIATHSITRREMTSRNGVRIKPKVIHAVIAIVISLTLLVVVNSAQSLSLDTTFNPGVSDLGGEGYVSAIQPDGKILVGGSFDLVNGVRHVCLARLNPDGTLDNNFNTGNSGPNLAVTDIVILDDGKILIGGYFGEYNGTPIRGIARLLPDGNLDTTFNPGGIGINAGGYVASIALQQTGKILITGSVTSYNDVTTGFVLRLNDDGTLDESFITLVPFAIVAREIAVQSDDRILVVGSFIFTYNGQEITSFLRLNADGTLDQTFNAGTATNRNINSLSLQSDGKIVIGGWFESYNGTPRVGLARVNADGSLDDTFMLPNTLLNNIVRDTAIQQDGKILAAGTFNDGDAFLRSMVLLNEDGSIDSSLNARADDAGSHVMIQPDGARLLTGDFKVLPGGESRFGITRYDANGGLDVTFQPSLAYDHGEIRTMALQPDGKIIIGGLFGTANGVLNRNIARLNPDGTLDDTFTTGIGPYGNGPPEVGPYGITTTDSVNSVVIQEDGKILVGGEFTSFGSQAGVSLVRLNTDGSIDGTFNSSEIMYSNIEDMLVMPDDKIVITGRIAYLPYFRGIGRLNADGSFDTTFGTGGIFPSTNMGYRVLQQPDGKLLFGGKFLLPPGRGLVRTDLDGTRDTSFGTNGSTGVLDMFLQPDGKIVLGGSTITGGGRIGRVNADGTSDNSYNIGTGANGTVFSLSPQSGGKLMIGGAFNGFNGVARSRLARLNSDGSLDPTFASGFDSSSGRVYSMIVQPDGKLLVGGTFKSYGGSIRNRLLRLQTNPTFRTSFDYDGDSKSDISVFRPTDGNWYLQQSMDGFYAVNFGIAADKIVPADYDGDGKTDVAVYRPSTGVWYVVNSSDGTFSSYGFGIEEDLPAPADYDGDGKADITVFRPSTGTWYRQNSSDGSFAIVQFGTDGDRPTIGDFDGDGKADVAVFRPSGGAWYQLNSSDGSFFAEQFGISIDKIVPADYDGDGKTDIAIYRPADGLWYVKNSANGTYTPHIFGIAEDIPVPGDYDGDGKADIAVFRPSNGHWYISNSSNGSFTIFPWGQNGDKPTPSAFGS